MEKLLYQTLKYPKMIIALSVFSTLLFFLAMIQNSRMETDLDEYMPRDHPAFIYSDQAEEWFNIQDGIIVAIENRAGIYNSGTLEKVKKLTRALQAMDEINKDDVTSLYSADNIVGSEFGLEVRPFFKKTPGDSDELGSLRQAVLNNEMIYGRLVNLNETVTLIVAEIADDAFSQEFYQRITSLSKEFEGPEKLYVAGRPIVEGTMAYLGPRDMQRMVPIVVAVIILILMFLLRSARATLFTMLVVLFSVIWAFGLMAILKIPIYAVSTMIPVMLIAIGVADGIHLYSHLHLYVKKRPYCSGTEATVDMIRNMWKPVAMTSVTTAVGFISLLTSDVYPIKYFGLFTAFGVLMAMVFSLLLIPAGLVVFGLPRWKQARSDDKMVENRFLTAIATGVVRHKYLTFAVTIVIVVVSLYGMSKVWINSSFLEKFEKTSDIVQTDAFINRHFGGTSTLNVIIDASEEGAFKQPAVLNAIDKMQADLESSLDVVGNSFALTDYLRRLNKVMHADSEAYNRIPENSDLVAQYLLLYEMSGDPENLWKVVDYNYRKANVTFQLKSDNSIALNSAISQIETHLPALKEQGLTLHYAGSGYKGLVFTDLILEGQVKSLVLSIIIIIILLSLMFKRLSAGLIGAVPIIITAVIGFGVMGLLDIPLSTTTALLSSIAIGIGIDYAVHFLERYKIYALRTGDKLKTAGLTMQHSGRAIALNAIVVIAGFLVLLASVFPPNRILGALVSMNMFTSFLGTVTIMYLLLNMTNLYIKSKEKINEKV